MATRSQRSSTRRRTTSKTQACSLRSVTKLYLQLRLTTRLRRLMADYNRTLSTDTATRSGTVARARRAIQTTQILSLIQQELHQQLKSLSTSRTLVFLAIHKSARFACIELKQTAISR